VDLAPQQATVIEKTVSALFAAAAKDSGAFEGRRVRSLQRVAGKLASWNSKGDQAAAVTRLQVQLAAVCGKAPAAGGQKAACDGLLKTLSGAVSSKKTG